MDRESVLKKLEAQREFFRRGNTRPMDARLDALRQLERTMMEMESEINAALKEDLGKSAAESYMCETGMVRAEIHHMLHHAKGYAQKRRVRTPLAQFPSSSFTLSCPYGTALIMSPWNYPLMLALEPAVDAIAAGNTVVLKPSAYAPCTAKVLETLISRALPSEWAFVVTGGREENAFLLDCEFDIIFFTGGMKVGHLVLEKAAAHLTPVILEMGGKSPVIVDETADIRLAARRIAFGKYLNCGQTCVAPDYVYCDNRVHDALVDALKSEIEKQYGKRPLENQNYGRIVNFKHFERLRGLMNPEKRIYGGDLDEEHLRIAPTLLDNVTWDDAVMQEEIFGPILPILSYSRLDDALNEIGAHSHPLALYLFSSDKDTQRTVMHSVQFGGGCVNDTIIHLATSAMPFGGVGGSGMGAYHGKVGFDAFTHRKSIVSKKTWLDLPMRYQPYRFWKKKLIRMFLK